MMYYHAGNMGFGYGLIGMLFTALWWVLVVCLVISILRWLRKKDRHHGIPWMQEYHKTPIDLLKERYAKGEISTADYEERKKVLEG